MHLSQNEKSVMNIFMCKICGVPLDIKKKSRYVPVKTNKSKIVTEELRLHFFFCWYLWCLHHWPIITTLYGSHRGWLLEQLSGCKSRDATCQRKCISRGLTANQKNVGEAVTNTTQLAPCPLTWSHTICGGLVSERGLAKTGSQMKTRCLALGHMCLLQCAAALMDMMQALHTHIWSWLRFHLCTISIYTW